MRAHIEKSGPAEVDVCYDWQMPNRVICCVLATAIALSACDRGPAPSRDAAAPEVSKASTVVADQSIATSAQSDQRPSPDPRRRPDRDYRVVHVIVALCDNANQGIVKVPAELGNGQDPRNSLYWGAMYGVKTFLSRSSQWQRVDAEPWTGGDTTVLDAAVFRATLDGQTVYLIAEAYDGAAMRTAVDRLLACAAGSHDVTVKLTGESGASIAAGGLADLICFVGHNGLMDFKLDATPEPAVGDQPGGAMVFACKSSPYFDATLTNLGCPPLVTTHGLMAPEAYVLDAAVRAWATDAPPASSAAVAYAKYQKCSLAAANRLFGVR